MRAFFFGAGSSYGTLKEHPACPPTVANFGEILCKRFPAGYPNLEKAAEQVGQKLSEIRLDHLWECVDYYAKLSGFDGALGPEPTWLWPAVEGLRRNALLSLYGRRVDEAADSLEKSTDYTLGRLISSVSNGDVVISFNWDTLVERLAVKFDRSLRHSSAAPVYFVRFLKPHGSASWPMFVPPARLVEGDPLIDSLNLGSEPLVLGAVPIKSELIREVQHQTPHVFQVIMHQWRGVIEAIRDADEIVVVGYSFPKEDQYGRFLFKQALRLRDARPIRIEYYSLSAAAGASILEVFGKQGTQIVWRGPADPGIFKA